MSDHLVNRFFETELNDYIRKLIEEVVAGDAPRRYLTFNVHNVAIDVRNGSVTIEDVLDPSNESTVTLSFAASSRAIGYTLMGGASRAVSGASDVCGLIGSFSPRIYC